MLFEQTRALQNGMLVEHDGVIYIGGRGYDLTTLEYLPSKTLGSLGTLDFGRTTDNYTPGNQPASPMLLPRYMSEAISGLAYFKNAGTAYDTPLSMDHVVSGYGYDDYCASPIDQNTAVAVTIGAAPFNAYCKIQADGATEVRIDGAYAIAAGSDNYSRIAAPIRNFGKPLQATAGLYGNAANYSGVNAGIRVEAPQVSWCPPFGAPTGFIFDTEPGAVAAFGTGTAASHVPSVNRYAGDTLTLTSIYAGPSTSLSTLQSAAMFVGTAARRVGSKKRAYMLNLYKSNDAANYLKEIFSTAIEYDSIGTMAASGAARNKVDMGSYQIDQCPTRSTSTAYYLEDDNGDRYVVAFTCNYSGNGFGTVFVFKEIALGQLQLVNRFNDTVQNGMRNILCVNPNNREWLVMTGVGIDTWRWNATTKRPERVASISNVAPLAAGKDSLGRLWIIERLGNAGVPQSYNVHLYPPEGKVSWVDVRYTGGRIAYENQPITTSVTVNAYDLNHKRLAVETMISLTGPATFADGNQTRKVTTSADADTPVQIVVTGPGKISVSGDL